MVDVQSLGGRSAYWFIQIPSVTTHLIPPTRKLATLNECLSPTGCDLTGSSADLLVYYCKPDCIKSHSVLSGRVTGCATTGR